MSINLTLIGQLVFFAVFVWFCMKFVWPPIINALDERQAKIADGLAAAERGQKSQEEAQLRIAEEIKMAKEQAAEIISKAEKRGGEIVEEAKADATTEKDRIIASGHSEIEKEINMAKEELRGQVANLAVEGAQKILAKEVDSKAHAGMLDDLAAKL